jgi:hypothetical protein
MAASRSSAATPGSPGGEGAFLAQARQNRRAEILRAESGSSVVPPALGSRRPSRSISRATSADSSLRFGSKGSGKDAPSVDSTQAGRGLARKRSMIQLDLAQTYERQLEECFSHALVHPQHPAKLSWDVCLSMLICYSALVVPYRVFMLASAQGAMKVFELAIDCVFMADIALSFRTAYVDETGKLVVQQGAIARLYMRTWFLIDVPSSLPYDFILGIDNGEDGSLGSGSEPRILQLLRMLRLVRLLKLARLLKLGRILGKLQEEGWVNPSTLELVKLIVYLMLLVHLAGCIWHYVAASSDDEQTWLHAADATELSTHHRYFLAIYWALTTMSTIGYGDIVAQNELEYWFAVLVMLIGASVFGVVIGGMTDLIDNLDPERQRKAQRMAVIKEYVYERSFPKALQRQVIDYYAHYLNDFADIETGLQILSELPPPLRTEIMLALNQHIIERIDFLKQRDAQFIVSVCICLKPMLAAPMDAIYSEGDVSAPSSLASWARARARVDARLCGTRSGLCSDAALCAPPVSRPACALRWASRCTWCRRASSRRRSTRRSTRSSSSLRRTGQGTR